MFTLSEFAAKQSQNSSNLNKRKPLRLSMQVSDLQINDEHKTISPDTTLDVAAKEILELGRGVLVVLENGSPLGILTDSHILLALSKSLDCRNETCRNHLDSNFISVSPTNNVKSISLEMRSKKPSSVMVVDDSDTFIGYFSPNDYREALSSL